MKRFRRLQLPEFHALFPMLLVIFCLSPAQQNTRKGELESMIFSLQKNVNQFSPAAIESTKAGYQYWFADRGFIDGRTLKMSVVRPHAATHPPHQHGEDEFFFVLEGTAEAYLNGKTQIITPYASFYCPSGSEHGIRNVGDAELKYLVIKQYDNKIPLGPFYDSSHHWYDILDEVRVIAPMARQERYSDQESNRIADNILLYQKSNGGWPKNYDMQAVLTKDQYDAVLASKNELNTTFDNGATHSHVAYLAQAYGLFKTAVYKEACLKGLDFILSAQYPNGGWPQFYPDINGYRKYITFNDGAMIGIMKLLHDIVTNDPAYSFVDPQRRSLLKQAYTNGIACILKCQIQQKGIATVWCQQHDNRTYEPQKARTYELPSLCSLESAEIVQFLMSIENPGKDIVGAVQSAIAWYKRSAIKGIRIDTVDAPRVQFQYHTTSIDRVAVDDPKAPPIWTRFYELGTNRPFFSNRDGIPVYTLAEVDRERRTGYGWYAYAPAQLLHEYSAWEKKWLQGK
ncbi:MAG: pectate lyase [bacterium]